MHARSEGHDNGTDGQWDEVESALATANSSRSQRSRTETKYPGIVTTIMLRVNLTAQIVQLLYQNAQLLYIPDESPKLIHTGYSHIQGHTSFPASLPQDDILEACESGKIIPNLVW